MAAPRIRHIPCPLCLTPTRASDFTRAGICPTCSDARRDSRRDHVNACMDIDDNKNAEHIEAYKRVVALGRRRIEAEKEAARKRELEAAKKEISAIQREQASLALARRSVLHYIERRKPTYKVNWYIEDVARRIEKFYDDVVNERSPRLILACPSRHGKVHASCTPIHTANRGLITHGELVVGDLVYGLDGEPTEVVAISEEMPLNMEIEFSDGSVFPTHENHEWQVAQRTDAVFRVLSTKNIYYNKFGSVRALISGGRPTYKVPDTPALKGEDLDLPMHPYALGCWLGDGSSGSPTITHAKNELDVVSAIESLGYVPTRSAFNADAGSSQTYFGRPSTFMSELRELDVVNNKHIPDIYLRASEQQRLELIAGLIDTDGHVEAKTGRVRFVNANKRLIDGFEFLARSLGQKPYITEANPCLSSSGIQGKQKIYTCGFQATRTDFPMRISRKKIQRAAPKQNVFITRIEYKDYDITGQCIQVAAKDGMYLVGKNLIPTHNSELASDSGVAWALGNWPWLSIVVASYSDDLPTKFSKSIRAQLQSEEFHKVFPNGGRISKTDAAAGAWLTTQGGGLKAVGCGGGLLGFGANALILDDIIRSAEDADNPATLENAYDWMTSTAMSRLAPGGGILLIMQRLAPLDPVGRLHANQKEEEQTLEQLRADIRELESKPKLDEDDEQELMLLRKEADELDESMDRYHTVIYPALAVQKEFLTPEGEIVRVADDREIQPDWRLLRMPGDALHPERYSRNALLKLQRANNARFQAMYMLDPMAESGEYFVVDDFQRYELGRMPKKEAMHKYAAWDLAISTKTHADYTCGIAGGIDHEGTLWLFEIVHGRFGGLDLVADLVIDLHKRWGCNMSGLEKTGIELALGPILRNRMAERREYIALAEGASALKPIADKRVRARTLQAMCRQGRVRVPHGDLWDSFIAQCTQFPVGQHDDMVDAASWLAIMASKDSLPHNPADKSTLRSRIRDAYAALFDREDDDSVVSYMDS